MPKSTPCTFLPGKIRNCYMYMDISESDSAWIGGLGQLLHPPKSGVKWIGVKSGATSPVAHSLRKSVFHCLGHIPGFIIIWHPLFDCVTLPLNIHQCLCSVTT